MPATPPTSDPADRACSEVMDISDVSKVVHNGITYVELATLRDAIACGQVPDDGSREEMLEMDSEPSIYTPRPKGIFKESTDALMTERGFMRLQQLYDGVARRTPGMHGITHIPGDFEGYGAVEIIEGQIDQYDKEQKKKEPDEMLLYEIIEALAFFLNCDESEQWYRIDDGSRVESLVELLGATYLDFLHRFTRLEPPHLTAADIMERMEKESSITIAPPQPKCKNQGLLMGMMIGVAKSFEYMLSSKTTPQTTWKWEIVKIAQQDGIEILRIGNDCKRHEIMDEPIPQYRERKNGWNYIGALRAYKKCSHTVRWGKFVVMT